MQGDVVTNKGVLFTKFRTVLNFRSGGISSKGKVEMAKNLGGLVKETCNLLFLACWFPGHSGEKKPLAPLFVYLMSALLSRANYVLAKTPLKQHSISFTPGREQQGNTSLSQCHFSKARDTLSISICGLQARKHEEDKSCNSRHQQ